MSTIIKRAVDFLTSLRLTVALLFLGLIIVFTGTLAQVELGLYEAQNRFFRSFFLWWRGVPVFPAGYTLGVVLLVNLFAAHAKRFELSRKKIGIFMIHAGVILLLLGQLLTDLLSVESFMRLAEGHAKNYSESSRSVELAFVDSSANDFDQVIAIPSSIVAGGGEIKDAALPFAVQVKEYHANSTRPKRNAGGDGNLEVESREITRKEDERNMPSARIEIIENGKSLGTWLVSLWLDQSHTITVGGKEWQFGLRPTRHYKPFHIELLDFRHDKYKGTDIPKNFSSQVRIMNPTSAENREALIYMNNPLRYGGETYFQGSFDQNDPRVSILQVVRNPGWLTPYLGCAIVGLGLIVQFLSHLIPFVRRSALPDETTDDRAQKRAPTKGAPS